MSTSQPFPDPYGGPQAARQLPEDQINVQLSWLNECVHALQEQNRHLYEQVAMLQKAVNDLINSSSPGSSRVNGYDSGQKSTQVASAPPMGQLRKKPGPVGSKIKVTFTESKNRQTWSKEDQEMAKKWESRGVVPCFKGKPINHDKWIAAYSKVKSSQANSSKAASGQTSPGSTKESSGKPSGQSSSAKTPAPEREQGSAKPSGNTSGQVSGEKKPEPPIKAGPD